MEIIIFEMIYSIFAARDFEHKFLFDKNSTISCGWYIEEFLGGGMDCVCLGVEHNSLGTTDFLLGHDLLFSFVTSVYFGLNVIRV